MIKLANKKVLLGAFLITLFSFTNISNLKAAGSVTQPKEQSWKTDGIFGSFDRKQLKRGWQVYNEVCSSCHSVRLIYYRNLTEIGFSPDEIKEIFHLQL